MCNKYTVHISSFYSKGLRTFWRDKPVRSNGVPQCDPVRLSRATLPILPDLHQTSPRGGKGRDESEQPHTLLGKLLPVQTHLDNQGKDSSLVT